MRNVPRPARSMREHLPGGREPGGPSRRAGALHPRHTDVAGDLPDRRLVLGAVQLAVLVGVGLGEVETLHRRRLGLRQHAVVVLVELVERRSHGIRRAREGEHAQERQRTSYLEHRNLLWSQRSRGAPRRSGLACNRRAEAIGIAGARSGRAKRRGWGRFYKRLTRARGAESTRPRRRRPRRAPSPPRARAGGPRMLRVMRSMFDPPSSCSSKFTTESPTFTRVMRNGRSPSERASIASSIAASVITSLEE